MDLINDIEIIVISRPDYFEGEAVAINRLFADGMGILHLRKPANDPARFRELLSGINPLFYSRIAIHQHHDLAGEFSIRRLHYPEKFRQSTALAVLEGQSQNGFVLSSSIHQLSQLPDLPFLDYVFYGPVFNSISKPGYKSVVDPGFRLPIRSSGPKVVAIGGITNASLETVKQMNFDGAALLGAIWAS